MTLSQDFHLGGQRMNWRQSYPNFRGDGECSQPLPSFQKQGRHGLMPTKAWLLQETGFPAAASSHMPMKLLQWWAQVKKSRKRPTVTHTGPKRDRKSVSTLLLFFIWDNWVQGTVTGDKASPNSHTKSCDHLQDPKNPRGNPTGGAEWGWGVLARVRKPL